MHQPRLPRICWSFFFSSGWHRWPLKLAGCVSGGCGSGDADFSRHGPDVIFEAENTQAKSFWAPSLGPPFRRQVSVCRGANLDGSYLQIWTGLRSSSEPPSPSWGQVFRMRLMPGQSKSFQLSTVMVKWREDFCGRRSAPTGCCDAWRGVCDAKLGLVLGSCRAPSVGPRTSEPPRLVGQRGSQP